MTREQTFTIPPASTLWAWTKCDGWTIPIYRGTQKNGLYGVTYTEKVGRVPYIVLYPPAFKTPQVLDETLLHEYVHVVEDLMAHELRKPDPPGCSQLARVMGKCLSEMLRNLTQVGLGEAAGTGGVHVIADHENAAKQKRKRK